MLASAKAAYQNVHQSMGYNSERFLFGTLTLFFPKSEGYRIKISTENLPLRVLECTTG